MSKKLGKFLIATAAIGTAAAAAYYFMKKKNAETPIPDVDSVELDSKDSVEDPNYVSLTPETKEDEEKQEAFTPLKDTVSEITESVGETVEEFFDENDFQEAEQTPATE